MVTASSNSNLQVPMLSQVFKWKKNIRDSVRVKHFGKSLVQYKHHAVVCSFKNLFTIILTKSSHALMGTAVGMLAVSPLGSTGKSLS